VRRRIVIAAAGVLAAALACTSSVRAEWRRTSDIELGTAYTLEEKTL